MPLNNPLIPEIQDEGVQVALKHVINFIGAGVTASNNTVDGRADVTIPGAGAPAAHQESHVAGGSDAIASYIGFGAIPTISAGRVGTGVFEYGRLPTIAAGLVGTGILEYARIPTLAADNVGTGVLVYARIPTIAAGLVGTGLLGIAYIPTLSADWVGTGILAYGRIPTLAGGLIGTGLVPFAAIPTISAQHVATGVLNAAQIPTNSRLAGMTIVLDGGGTLIGSGTRIPVEVPFTGTILSATLLADAIGSLIVNFYKNTYTNYPTIAVIGTIALGNVRKNQDTTLTGFTLGVTQGDILEAYALLGSSGATRVSCALKIVKQ